MYFVFLKKGVVVDVLTNPDSKEGIADRLLNGTADELKQVETFDELRTLLGQKESISNPAEQFFEKLGKRLETFVHSVCDALEKKAKPVNDADELLKTMKAVGEGVQGVVKQVKKAQARKKKTEEKKDGE